MTDYKPSYDTIREGQMIQADQPNALARIADALEMIARHDPKALVIAHQEAVAKDNGLLINSSLRSNETKCITCANFSVTQGLYPRNITAYEVKRHLEVAAKDEEDRGYHECPSSDFSVMSKYHRAVEHKGCVKYKDKYYPESLTDDQKDHMDTCTEKIQYEYDGRAYHPCLRYSSDMILHVDPCGSGIDHSITLDKLLKELED